MSKSMTILDLDEAQGLTAEMLRFGLEREGWFCGNVAWEKIIDGFVVLVTSTTELFRYVADPQDFLRQVNPRLRLWPSAAARAAHPSHWLAVDPEEGTACMGMFRKDIAWFAQPGGSILTEDDSFARFWPCDSAGNKVRWPTDAQGNML